MIRHKNKIRKAVLILMLLTFLFSITACSRVQFIYEAGEGGSITGKTSQSIGIGKNGSTVTAAPDDGCFFVRWSDGSRYAERQDKDAQSGKTVTAIFAPKLRVYKILMVYVTEIKATLSTSDGIDIKVDYRLTETELKICELISVQMSAYLNDMMDGLVYFEIDSVFTTQPVGEESITRLIEDDGSFDYKVSADRLPELTHGVTDNDLMFTDYDSVVTTFSMNDQKYMLHVFAGIGGRKYASVNLEDALSQLRINNISVEVLFDLNYKSIIASWDIAIDLPIHEFAHTIEANFWYAPAPSYMDYHTVLNSYGGRDTILVTKLYFLGQAIVNGETGGIPQEFWERYRIDK